MYQLKTRIIPDEQGNVVRRNTNFGKENYGSIRMDQTVYIWNGNFLNKRNRVTFLNGVYEELLEFSTLNKLNEQNEIEGNIILVEQFIPFYEGQSPKLNPQTRRLSLVDGQMVYQQTFFDTTGTKKDTILEGIKSIGDLFDGVLEHSEENFLQEPNLDH